MVKRIDPVAERLASVGHEQAASVLDWLDGQHERDNMRRRAFLCSLSGWLLLTVAALVSWIVAASLASDVQEIFGGAAMFGRDWVRLQLTIPMSITLLPIVLGIVSVLLLIGGIVGWRLDIIPGLRSTRSAIDWTGVSDSMNRLLAVGCTYPEAFRTTAKISRSRSIRRWLIQAAEHVERGDSDVLSRHPDVDTETLELLVEPSKTEPHRQWGLASEHFYDTAQRRLALLLGAVPMMSTVLSGFLIWMSISTSLGWMWRAAAEMIGGLS